MKWIVAVAALCTALSASATGAGGPVDALQAPANVAPVQPTAGVNEVHVPLTRDGSTFVAPVTINKAITLAFTVDSGAGDVSIPADVVLKLKQTGALAKSDFIGRKTYTLANGSTVPLATFMLRSLTVGGLTIENVRAGETPAQSPLLLGQTFLARLNSWSFDNARHELVLH